MSISLFHRGEHILQLGIRAGAIMLPTALLLKLEASKPECESEIQGLFAKLSKAQGMGSNPNNAYCVIDLVEPDGFFVQALVPATREHILLEAVSEKFQKNWKQVVTPEKRAILNALGFEEPGPRSPNYLLEIPGADAPSIGLAARIAALTLSEVFGARNLKDAKVKVSLPGEAFVKTTLGAASVVEQPIKEKGSSKLMVKPPSTDGGSVMNFKLTIDKQPLILKLEAILALFGNARTMEFAEGKWTPFVFFELEMPPGVPPTVEHIDFTNMTESEISDALKSLPREVNDFPGLVRDEIEKLEKH